MSAIYRVNLVILEYNLDQGLTTKIYHLVSVTFILFHLETNPQILD